MKVLYVLPSGAMYGDNIALMGIMDLLVNLGVTPFFIVIQRGAIEDCLKAKGYSYQVIQHPYNMYPLSSSIRGYLHELRCQLSLVKRYRAIKEGIKVIKKFEPDIIHTNTSTNLLGYILARLCKIQHVMHLREYMRLDHNYEYIPSKSFFEQLIKWPLNHNIAITPGVNEYFNNQSNTMTIYDGVVSKINAPDINIQKKENQILFVGRIVETKGVREAIVSFCKTDTNEHRFVIAGTGSARYVEELKQEVLKYNKSNEVTFLGYRSDVYDLMRKSKAIIVSSRFEAFGFITVEAMYNGCVVIGKNTAGTKEQFDNGIMQYKREIGFRYSTPEELEEIIKTVCNTGYGKYKDMRKMAQNVVLSSYTKEKSADEVYAYYCKILS